MSIGRSKTYEDFTSSLLSLPARAIAYRFKSCGLFWVDTGMVSIHARDLLYNVYTISSRSCRACSLLVSTFRLVVPLPRDVFVPSAPCL